jgi:tetratricopeptide (TPR) repeat protein
MDPMVRDLISLALEKEFMRLFRQCILTLGLSALVVGCSTGMITLQSTPSGAKVYVASVGAEGSKLVGETPLSLKPAELETHYKGVGPVQIEIKKDGYLPSRTVITDVSGAELTVSLNLEPTTGLEDFEKLNSVVDMTFESQRLARVGKYDEALKKIVDIKKEAPQLAAVYELEGGIFYLQKKFRESLDSYKLAVKFNPKNPEAQKMRANLEAILSGESKPPQPVGAKN